MSKSSKEAKELIRELQKINKRRNEILSRLSMLRAERVVKTYFGEVESVEV